MSMPVNQLPPGVTVAQEPLNTHSTHGSVGPVIAVLVVIMILGVVAVIIGRVCSGRRILGYGRYDLESWAESKCSSCIDGRISISSPAPRSNLFAASASAPIPVQTHQQTKHEEQSPQQQNANL
ncbi:uncharacterized protein LOC126686657 [Mercurialis annua]|uniref:uncharacterized protein LOC126686657 n=1 Tax=Mercurialis annua TaxID=3986 RepID=UPI00215F6829|nr:uncharacterized protein LOC126686657 [Mercurialis annua]